jgi:hypothetical protein
MLSPRAKIDPPPYANSTELLLNVWRFRTGHGLNTNMAYPEATGIVQLHQKRHAVQILALTQLTRCLALSWDAQTSASTTIPTDSPSRNLIVSQTGLVHAIMVSNTEQTTVRGVTQRPQLQGLGMTG